MSPTGRGTDPLDHLRLQCSEGNVVSASVAKAAIEFVRARIAELERKAAAWDAVKGNIHEAASGTGKFEGYECDAWWHEEHPTTKAISAAVAAKESKHEAD